MGVALMLLLATITIALAWLVMRRVVADRRARKRRDAHGAAGRLRSEILKELDRLEARHRRLQGHLAVADPSGGPGRASWDLRTSASALSRAELVELRARAERAYANLDAEPGHGLSARCAALSEIAREVLAWSKVMDAREAALGHHLRPSHLTRLEPARTEGPAAGCARPHVVSR